MAYHNLEFYKEHQLPQQFQPSPILDTHQSPQRELKTPKKQIEVILPTPKKVRQNYKSLNHSRELSWIAKKSRQLQETFEQIQRIVIDAKVY